jgi:hypothetical protein
MRETPFRSAPAFGSRPGYKRGAVQARRIAHVREIEHRTAGLPDQRFDQRPAHTRDEELGARDHLLVDQLELGLQMIGRGRAQNFQRKVSFFDELGEGLRYGAMRAENGDRSHVGEEEKLVVRSESGKRGGLS